MDRKKRGSYIKHKDNPTSFKSGSVPWNKGLVGYLKGKVVSDETRKKLRVSSTGRCHTPDVKHKMSEAHKKFIGPLNPFYGKKHTDETIALNRKATTERWKNQEYRNKVLVNRIGKQCGENNNFWKGGVTPLNMMLRSCDKYKQWIKDVFSRDNFTCQECFKRGTYLEAHHEKRFSIIMKEFLSLYDQFSPIEDKETLLRLAIKYEPFWTLENGKTMCSKCHNLTKGAIHGS